MLLTSKHEVNIRRQFQHISMAKENTATPFTHLIIVPVRAIHREILDVYQGSHFSWVISIEEDGVDSEVFVRDARVVDDILAIS